MQVAKDQLSYQSPTLSKVLLFFLQKVHFVRLELEMWSNLAFLNRPRFQLFLFYNDDILER